MKLEFRICAMLGFIAVAFGAFGAHALKSSLSPEMLAVWQTGTQYDLAHSILGCGAALVAISTGSRRFRIASRLFIAGICIFSGSLYALALTKQKILGAVTPLGGICFLAGWGVLAWASSDLKNQVSPAKPGL